MDNIIKLELYLIGDKLYFSGNYFSSRSMAYNYVMM